MSTNGRCNSVLSLHVPIFCRQCPSGLVMLCITLELVHQSAGFQASRISWTVVKYAAGMMLERESQLMLQFLSTLHLNSISSPGTSSWHSTSLSDSKSSSKSHFNCTPSKLHSISSLSHWLPENKPPEQTSGVDNPGEEPHPPCILLNS